MSVPQKRNVRWRIFLLRLAVVIVAMPKARVALMKSCMAVYHVSHATALTALRTLSALAQAHRMTMLEVSGEMRTRAGHIFEQFHDQTFSFTDCTSFALCEAHHIQHAVTVDKDFVIFGLVILPEALAQSVLSPSQH